MTTQADIGEMNKTLVDIHAFVQGKVDEQTGELRLQKEEVQRMAADILALQEAQAASRRLAILQGADGTAEEAMRVPVGHKYAGMDLIDLRIMDGIAQAQQRHGSSSPDAARWERDVQEARGLLMGQADAGLVSRYVRSGSDGVSKGFLSQRVYREVAFAPQINMDNAVLRALDSTTGGAGDELVPTLEARSLWMDVNLATLVQAAIPTIPMPSNPFTTPLQLGNTNWYPSGENVAATETTPTTARTPMTAYELVGFIAFSWSLEEDAIIALLPEIRSNIVRNAAEVLDDVILNADTTVANNINADGATISASTAGKAHWLLGYDGLLHLPIVDNTSQGNDHNADVSDDMFNEIRAKLGKYGARPSELLWVTDVNTFIRAQGISNFRTMDKLGPNATLLNGMLGQVEGIPVLVSEQMGLADTDGKVTSAGNSEDNGRLLIVNRTQWRQGFRRDFTIDTDRNISKRQTEIVLSFRHALIERTNARSSATHTAAQYNITNVGG